MKITLLLSVVFLSGCATRCYEDNHLAFESYSNIKKLHWKGRYSELSGDMINDKPTQAAFDGVAKGAASIGTSAGLFFAH